HGARDRRDRGCSSADRATSGVAGELRGSRDAPLMARNWHRPEDMTANIETTKLRDVPVPASRVGLGTWPMGGVQWGGTDDDPSVRTIHAALDRGITVIDTAPAYGFGHSEEVVGRAIAEVGKRDRVVLATKCGLERHGDALYRNSSRAHLMREIEESLERLR